MKHNLYIRSLSLLVILSLLLTGLVLPAVAVPASDATNLLNTPIANDEFGSDDIILQADDPAIAEESKILQYVDSTQFNAAGHTQRLTALEELNTYVFANADGTRSVYVMYENVKYVDENGAVKEKDISLKKKTGGFGIAQSNVELLIPNNPVQGVDLEYAGYAVKLIPQGLESAVSAVQADNSVVYDKAYGEKTKLVYTPLLSGVKEDIVLTEYTEDAAYTFILETDGLHLYCNESGYYLADSEKAEPVFYLGEILIYDAIGKPDKGTMTVETLSAGQKYLLTVTANDNFLSDPTTVYPVTIDPSITVSDTTANNSILDAPIFSGYPNINCGTYVYNRVGTPSQDYGVGRTVVKLTGLTSQNEYQSITASQITDAKFYIKEASGGLTQTIKLHPLTSNTTWTETNVTWNNVGSYSTDVNYGNTMFNGQWTAFNITELVKAWKNNTYSADAGFILMNANEANDGAFYASEWSTASYRPYVVMTYEPTISLNYTSVSIVEGGTRTLTATTNPAGQTVTWSTSNSDIAFVRPNGTVLARKAGVATITASMVDADGITRTATCTVYICVAGGVYYIQNLLSGYYLHVEEKIDTLPNVYQYFRYADTVNVNYRIAQMWKIRYLGEGRYSIRPMHKLDMALDVTGTNVDVYQVGTGDTLANLSYYVEWTIERDANGYVFKNDGMDSNVLQVENASTTFGANVVVGTTSASDLNSKWNLEEVTSPPSGAYLYDIREEAIVATATRAVDIGVSKSLSILQLGTVAYSGTNIGQGFTWDSSDDAIATVDSNGTVFGVSAGKVTITGYSNQASNHSVSYTLCVGFPSLFTSLINENILVADKLDLTDDGLFITTTPISTILIEKGISLLPTNVQYSETWYVGGFFDDWYLMGVRDETSVSYGLYKMREQESDYPLYDLDDPGVTISFIGLDSTKMTNCFNNNTDANKYELYQTLVEVVGPGTYATNDIITSYFADTASDGAYLIAEKSVNFFANCFPGNIIQTSSKLAEIFQELELIDEHLADPLYDQYAKESLMVRQAVLLRIPNALQAINNAAGTTIFDFDSLTITVQDKSNLTLHEKQAILACFTANVTFNSFAAEVEFHADAVYDWKTVFDDWYEAAIRADMAIGEDAESGSYDQYYDLNSNIVQAQVAAHGEY